VFFKCRVESVHWALKRLLQNSHGDLCSVWEAMIIVQHTKIKTSFETSTHVVGHVFKVTLYKKLLGTISRHALNQIAAEFECVNYVGINRSHCGCIMRTTHGLPYACELARYVVGSIPLDTIHMFWWRLSFSNQGLSKPEVTITEETKVISKRFEELDVCGKVTIKSKLREISYSDLNSMCAPPEKVKTKDAQKKQMTKHQRSTNHDPSYWEYMDVLYFVQNNNSSVKRTASSSEQSKPKRMSMLDQFHRAIAALLGMDEDSWYLVRNHLLKELTKWFDEYMNLLGGINRYEELKRSLLYDGLSVVYKFFVTFSWINFFVNNTK